MKLTRNWRKLVKVPGLGALYLSALVLFVYVGFPYERLRSYAVTQYNATQTGRRDTRLEIESLTWSWRFPGLVATGVRLVVPQEPDAGADPSKPVRPKYLRAGEVYATVSLLNLLVGKRSVSFGADALNGEIEGWLSDSGKVMQLSLDLEGIETALVPQIAGAIGLPVKGRMTGSVEIDVPSGKANLAEGRIELEVAGFEVGDGKAKIQNLMALPALNVGKFSLKAEINNGRVKIQDCSASGGELDLKLTGSIKLRRRLEVSTADLELKFRFSDKYKSKDEKTKVIFGDGKIPGLFDTVTKASLAKQEDGFYAARLSGPFNRIKPRPLRKKISRARKARARAARKRTSTPGK